MSNEIVGLVGEVLLGFADDTLLGGLRIGYQVARLTLGAVSGTKGRQKGSTVEDALNQMISSPKFDTFSLRFLA